ncbi:MAG TPA: hypothetical protein VMH77_04550 [Steroidobacteraceae bacterium]|nr:hypothetical protein [Steroidobacteraceae bacterium]
MRRSSIAALLLLAGTFTGCEGGQVRLANRANFTAALQDFLAQRGHVCLARYDWPVTVAGDARDPDARQMPVLEKLGLAAGRDTQIVRKGAGAIAVTVAAREYSLTAEGRKYYLHVPVVIRTAAQKVTHPGDFCVATLQLDRLVGWDPPQPRDGRNTTSLLFTYRITPVAWAKTPAVLHAFPALARALEGEGTMQLRVGVHLAKHGWVADELDER